MKSYTITFKVYNSISEERIINQVMIINADSEIDAKEKLRIELDLSTNEYLEITGIKNEQK